MPKRFIQTFSAVKVRNRGNTPHWEMEGAIYSLTFRLADSLPVAVLRRIHENRRLRERSAVTAIERLEIRRRWESELDEGLDAGRGACYMNDPAVADCVASTIRHFEGDRYDLYAWCVMPNHVHAVMSLRSAWSLDDVFHSWKSFSSKRANELLGRSGTFWQREYYDRIIRDSEDFERTVSYVLANPVKAGLKNWRWVGGAGGTPA
jgi:REP element-mobilizing transposase RayT